ncbi:hypothetical protein NE237_033117 [Protea cynaroides]|uniref:Uncharacterized protein n=1 Tax=Protea cynaroides TaxID=273540 RepID=A0A9Q0L4X5_9MAGN|nr:hypothetical protein NE237_033117 [Protea cynaroides]
MVDEVGDGLFGAVGSGLAELVVLAEQLNVNWVFSYNTTMVISMSAMADLFLVTDSFEAPEWVQGERLEELLQLLHKINGFSVLTLQTNSSEGWSSVGSGKRGAATGGGRPSLDQGCFEITVNRRHSRSFQVPTKFFFQPRSWAPAVFLVVAEDHARFESVSFLLICKLRKVGNQIFNGFVEAGKETFSFHGDLPESSWGLTRKKSGFIFKCYFLIKAALLLFA